MAKLIVQYPDDLLLASGKARNVVEEELKFRHLDLVSVRGQDA